MKIKTLTGLLICIVFKLYGQQKLPIDSALAVKWPWVSVAEERCAISPNGQYVAFTVNSQPIGSGTLVLRSLRNNWEKKLICENPQIMFFSADSKSLCWKQGDSIWLQNIVSDKARLLGINRSPGYPPGSKGDWIALVYPKQGSSMRLINLVSGKEHNVTSVKRYKWLSSGNQILISLAGRKLKFLDLATGKQKTFSAVEDFVLTPDEKRVILVKKNDPVSSLEFVQLDGKDPLVIWTGRPGEQPANFIFDKKNEQLSFQVQSSDNKIEIWLYKYTAKSAGIILDDDRVKGVKNLPISGLLNISDNGRWLFFSIRRKLRFLSNEKVTTPVDIWSYRDEILNPAQLNLEDSCRDYLAVMEIETKKIQLLEQADDEKAGYDSPGDYIILSKGGSNIGTWWPHEGSRNYLLIALENGKRTLIKKASKFPVGYGFSFSPTGRWIYYWDPELGHYFRIDPEDGKSVNLTDKLPVSFVENVEQLLAPTPVGRVIGWLPGDSGLFVYDNHDIWLLDPGLRKPALNVTNGYGRRHGIQLRLVYKNPKLLRGNEELLLSGFDMTTKCNGFFKAHLDHPGDPELLSMGPYAYTQYLLPQPSIRVFNPPLMAGSGKNKRWVLMRESATEYPNLFVSKDLKTFVPITNLQPQKKYNWLQSEPVSWLMYNGQRNYGVLYRPENFDPSKKYPVIFNYYEKLSHQCYQFPKPGLTTDNINIPWFVSRGYLVFTPDIQYNLACSPGGMTIGEAAYNAVASAGEYLSLRPYIDKYRMAIQGHSFGAQETNNIITHTNLFAAAAEMAGTADNFSSYLTLVGIPERQQHKMDHFQARMGATPWERPELYQRNSPVLNADKITTPLFIVHNKNDSAVDFDQGVELFMALRRLGKPCWLLQYDNSGHVLKNKDPLDYTIRLTQYFDHYLKGQPAPLWMTMNTLAQYKNKNNLYELDPKGNCGRDCKVCKEWNNKILTTNLKKDEK